MAVAFKPAATSSDITKGGNGGFSPLKRNSQTQKATSANPFAPNNNDRMAFKSNKDPVFVAFDHLDKQSVSKLAQDYVKDNVTASITKMFKKVKKAIV